MDKTTNLKRRGFLISVGLGGAAAAAVLGGGKLVEQQPSDGEKREKNAGYRVTEHVKSYYRTTKV